jgi:hypothetical protein
LNDHRPPSHEGERETTVIGEANGDQPHNPSLLVKPAKTTKDTSPGMYTISTIFEKMMEIDPPTNNLTVERAVGDVGDLG